MAKKNLTFSQDKKRAPLKSVPQVSAGEKKPIFVIFGILLLILLLTFLVIFKVSAPPQSPKGGGPIKVSLKTQTELVDEAVAVVRSGDYNALENLVRKQIKNVNTFDSKGGTLLLAAAAAGNADAVQLLIHAGANIDLASNYTGDTPLITALKNKQKVIIGILLAARADVNKINKYGQAPLILAIETGDQDIVRIILASGAVAGANSDRLLFYASKNNLLGVDAMLRAGVKPNVKNAKGFSPLIMAASVGNTEMAATLVVFQSNINDVDAEGSTALLSAVKYGHAETAEELLARNADVNKQNKKGETPLFWAAYRGMDKMAETLLGYGGDAYLPTTSGITPRKIAEQRRRTAVLKVFDNAGITD